MVKQIKWKILIPTLLIYVASIAIILSIVLYMASDKINNLSNDLMMEKNQRHSESVQVAFDKAMNTTRLLKPSFASAAVSNNGNREEAMASLTEIMQENPSIYGIYTLWEPNAYDGRDSEFVNKLGGDETGRFNAYIFRDNSGIVIEPLSGFNVEGDGDYYLIPKKTKEESVVGPYQYEANGVMTNIVSLTSPIVIDGEFKGIIGTDVSVESLVTGLEGITIFDTGYMFATEENGVLIYAPDPGEIGDCIFDDLNDEQSEMLRYALSSGDSVSIDTTISNEKQKLRILFTPVSVGKVYWLMGSLVPLSEINAAAEQMFLLGGGIAVVAVAIILVILTLIISNIVAKPIKRLVTLVSDVTSGNLDVNIDRENISKDETGELTLYIYNLADILKLLIKEIEAMSKEFDKGNIDARMDASQFAGSYKTVAESINNMMQGVLSDILTFMNCMKEFGNGNFDADIPKLSGKKVVMNENLDVMRNNLKSVASDIALLVNDASVGKLDSRANASEYKGDWAELLKGLNKLMEEIAAPINEAANVLQQVSVGNFDYQVKGNYQGDFLLIKNSINNSVTNIASYINEISSTLSEMANNDNLDQEITREYVGKFVEMKDALNNIINKFNKAMSDVYTAADQVAAGAGQVSESSMVLAQGANEQASSLEKLNDAILTVNKITEKNAENAKQAENLSASSENNAQMGDKNMKDMLVSMSEINNSSNNIAKIINTIDDIAFQTNLLALNAAVEAARAGEHGKGFAVVAEEVRNLASKSLDASKEIAGLITESIQKVNDGSHAASTTANTLHMIVDDVTKVSGIITSVSEASQQQAEALSQVTLGLSDVTNVVKSNSAASEEAASVSEELSGQADALRRLVSVFKIKRM